MDAGIMNVPFLGNKALKLANERNLQMGLPEADWKRGLGAAQLKENPLSLREKVGRQVDALKETMDERRGGSATDQAIGRQNREQNFESRLRRGRNLVNRGQKAGGGLSMKDAISLAKNPTPTGLALKLATPSGGTGPGGVPLSGEELKTMVGNALIKMSWSNLWLTFGHSIYVIDILFFAGFASKYLRQYIPEIGREWFPGALGKSIPAHALLPIKLGEIVAMCVITFLVLLIDLSLLAVIGFLVGLIVDGGRAVDSIPFI